MSLTGINNYPLKESVTVSESIDQLMFPGMKKNEVHLGVNLSWVVGRWQKSSNKKIIRFAGGSLKHTLMVLQWSRAHTFVVYAKEVG